MLGCLADGKKIYNDPEYSTCPTSPKENRWLKGTQIHHGRQEPVCIFDVQESKVEDDRAGGDGNLEDTHRLDGCPFVGVC